MRSTPKPVINWLISAIILIIIMIAIGGITRLTKSGLSMVEWHPITGILPPITYSDWAAEFNKYQSSPEYEYVNEWMTLNDFKKIFFWEYLHRLIGRLIGLWFIIPFFIFTKKQLIPKPLYKKLGIMFLLGGLQGFVGWYMVKSGLIDIPHVSHYRLTLHLVLAFGLIAYIFWTILEIMDPKKIQNISKKSSRLINSILVITIIQIIYGAFMAGLKAGFAWNTFPLMQGKFIPEGLFSLTPTLMNFVSNIMTIQFIHRITACILLILIIILWFQVRSIVETKYQTKSNTFLLISILSQFILGILTLLYIVPVSLAIIHQIVAALLLICIINVRFLLRN